MVVAFSYCCVTTVISSRSILISNGGKGKPQPQLTTRSHAPTLTQTNRVLFPQVLRLLIKSPTSRSSIFFYIYANVLQYQQRIISKPIIVYLFYRKDNHTTLYCILVSAGYSVGYLSALSSSQVTYFWAGHTTLRSISTSCRSQMEGRNLISSLTTPYLRRTSSPKSFPTTPGFQVRLNLSTCIKQLHVSKTLHIQYTFFTCTVHIQHNMC